MCRVDPHAPLPPRSPDRRHGVGQGSGVIIPNLLDYVRGSVIVFDTKATPPRTRQAGGIFGNGNASCAWT